LYDFHEYEISKDNMLKLTSCLIDINPKSTTDDFEKFMKQIYMGKHGVLYKMPTCILSMYYKFCRENKQMIP